ncbi:MAG: HD domain-containing protein [Candidatus Pacebacteria bacterium]|nr:HD domain-containing protein [Candidatus Paceibacterota bacterium]
MLNLSKILKFTELLNKFRQVQRRVLVNGEDRYENDTEHSYQLAMLALYIVNSQKLDLNHELILKYALIHDLVEVYAGDTYIYSTDTKEINSKEEREKKAMRQLKREFPEFPELHKIIKDYETKINKESRFIYSLDKIQPILNVYTDNGKTFKQEGVTLQMLIDCKKDKVAVSPEVKIYFDELIKLLKKEEKTLFKKQ